MVTETLQYLEEQELLTKETMVEMDQGEELIEQAVAVEETHDERSASAAGVGAAASGRAGASHSGGAEGERPCQEVEARASGAAARSSLELSESMATPGHEDSRGLSLRAGLKQGEARCSLGGRDGDSGGSELAAVEVSEEAGWPQT